MAILYVEAWEVGSNLKTNLLFQVKDGDSVPHRADDRVAIIGKWQVAFLIHCTKQVTELEKQ